MEPGIRWQAYVDVFLGTAQIHLNGYLKQK